MILIPLLALAVGIALGFLIRVPLSGIYGIYMGVAVIAGLDSVLGGTRSAIEGKFQTDVFVTGFIANIIAAFALAWLGDRIGIDLYFVAVIVMGWRIFTNLSLIRRFLLTKWHDARQRKKLEDEQQAQQTMGVT